MTAHSLALTAYFMFIAAVLIGTVVGLVRPWYLAKRRCQACGKHGSVLLGDRDTFCYRHQQQARYIENLERQMDHKPDWWAEGE